jgi:hypothetical protein
LHLDSKTDDETGEKVVVAMRFNLKRSTFPYSNTIGPEVEWPELPEWSLWLLKSWRNLTSYGGVMADPPSW